MGETSTARTIFSSKTSSPKSLVERDNEVTRILSCLKLNPFEYLNLPFDASPDDVKKQHRKLSLMVHPDKCKHPQAKEAFGALAKAQQLLLDQNERDYLLSQVNSAKVSPAEELRVKRKKQLQKDTASKMKSLVEEGKYEQHYEQSEEFQLELKMKVREILTEKEWRRRKMQMRISEEEGRLKRMKRNRKRYGKESVNMRRSGKEQENRGFPVGEILCRLERRLRKVKLAPLNLRQKIPTNPTFRGL